MREPGGTERVDDVHVGAVEAYDERAGRHGGCGEPGALRPVPDGVMLAAEVLMVARLVKGLAMLALAGCSWTEMPEGATAPLLVHDVTMRGELAGITIDESRVRGEGWCTEDGWMLDIYARGLDGHVVHAAFDIHGIEPGWATDVRLVETPVGTLVEEDGGPGGGSILGCAGPETDAWVFEQPARLAILDVVNLGDEMQVRYQLTFEVNEGEDVVDGQFRVQMPVVD